MASSRSNKSRSGSVLPLSNAFQLAATPPSSSAAATGFASSSSSFAARSSTTTTTTSSPFFHHQRSASPTRVHLVGIGGGVSAPSVRFSLDATRPTSPGRAIANKKISAAPASRRRTCMCSATTHPGSFRCSLHKSPAAGGGSAGRARGSPSSQLNMRRSAMTNSLVRIGTVEGDLVRRALAALIRPCAHQQRRRNGFQPRPSRLSVMSSAAGDGGV